MGSSETTSGGGWKPPSVEHLQTLLPQYEISRLLGHGGMGAVYEGAQSNLDRKVAIKILPETLGKDDNELNFTERFKLEAKSMARMNHPGIISVYDFGQTSEGQLYFVMEFIDGMDIHQYLKHHGGKLPQDSAIAIVAHVLDALGYAHERGIIHRDIKPANIMIKASGRVKVADFGLVKRLSASGEGSPDSAAITMSNVAIGTPDFVAPESLEIGRIVDHRADLYSIGVMFYQLLTGSVPRGNFKPPSGRVEGLDPRLDAIVSRAMEAEPDDRYSSAEEFREAIDEILSSPVPEDHYTGPVKPEKQPSGAVIAGGKRLHLTSIQKKSSGSGAAGPTGPVKGQKPPSGVAETGIEEEAKSGNPLAFAALIGLPLIAVGIGLVIWLGGGEKNNQPELPGPKSRAKPLVAEADSKPDRPKSDRPKPKSEPKSEVKVSPPKKAEPKPVAQASAATPEKPPVVEPPKPVASTKKPPKSETPPSPEPPKPEVTVVPEPAAPVMTVAANPALEPAPDDPVTKKLAEIDSKYRDIFETPYQEALANLNTQFVGALGREATAVTQTGDLDLVLAFQNEIKRIGNSEGAGLTDESDAPPKLKELRKTWHTQADQLEIIRAENQKKADIARDQAFDLLQQELVKAQNIEAAQRVKALREELTDSSAGSMAGAAPGEEPEWISLFDGQSLDGWKTSGDESAFSVVSGAIRARKAKAMLYYAGPDPQSGVFKNFEFHAKVKTEDAFNSGVYFHATIQDDEPVGGYEAQIANENRDPRKTGSLWEVSDVTDMRVSDGDWFDYEIRVKGKEITISINGEVVTRWTEPEDWIPQKPEQHLSQGYFALQSNPGAQNNRGGEVWFKEIRVRRLSE